MAPDIKAVIDRACRATTTTSDAVADLKQVNPSAHTFEAISRDLLFDFCDENDAVVLITRLLEIILEVVSHDLCGSDLPLAILEEAMDTQTIAQCDKLFSFLEKHRQTMTTRMGRGQTLLRLCNDLLRRLSKTKDTVFCGRILIFLSLVFPLSERSAVNLRGEYNLDNVTIYEEVPASDNDDKQETGVATEAKQNNENTTISSDSFYTTFWSLQQYFNNPAQLTTAPTILARFHANASTVIESLQGIMATMPKHEQAQKSSKDLSNRSSAEIDAVVRGHFTPKFLTSKKLLKLELADSSFRRQILIQFLIVFDYLLSLTAVNKEKLGTSASIPNRSMLNNYVLPVADAEWVSKLRDMVSNLLRIGRTGEDFYAIVENVLSRDRAWLRWKCNGCQPYDLPQIESIRADAAPAKLSSMTSARKPYQHTMGNAVLSKLWKDTASQAGYDSLQGSGILPEPSDFLPTIRALQHRIVEVQDEDEQNSLMDKRASNTWRALRVARTSDFRKFNERVANGDFEAFFGIESSPTDANATSGVDELPETSRSASDSLIGGSKRPAPDIVESADEKRPKLST